ncbi:MAG: Hsp20/alpha crystallin family protein [Beijerinckiaceae bacterium]|jgi:HSP20 family molecular chaperone IbpA
MLTRAERLHREFFRPVQPAARLLTWEPPVDVLETQHEVLVIVALPGVSAESIEVATDAGELVFAGIRTLPAELQTAVIHRMELPQGRFERRIRLPPGQYGVVRRSIVDGCLLISVQKEGAFHG